VIGIDTFGASAPIEALLPHFGFTVDRLIQVIGEL
jgi:transketolase